MSHQISKEVFDQVVRGYLESAKFADAPEDKPNCRFTKAARETAAFDVREFIDACGPLFDEAIAQPDYDADDFGRDFWLNRRGHGTGFWDRDELEVEATTSVIPVDRDGKQQAPVGSWSKQFIGDALSDLAYGNSKWISGFADPILFEDRGWLHF